MFDYNLFTKIIMKAIVIFYSIDQIYSSYITMLAL